MEPTLLGPQRSARCDDCRWSMRFSNEEILEDRPPPCPRCGQDVSLGETQPGRSVRLEAIDWLSASIRRGEMLAIQDRERDRFEVKRVVGFPDESIAIVDGDFWIDGRRFQKSISQFASLAIEVDRWSDVEGLLVANANRRPMELCYQSFSLWPRIGERLVPRPSPILDEYRCNARESRELVTVRDIGLKLTFSDIQTTPAKINVRIWFNGLVRSIPIELSAGPVQDESSRTLIVAAVDGRLLVGNERFSRSLDVNEYVLDGIDSTSDCSATKPISLTILDGQVSILQASIVRDIHYRGWNGENEFSLPAVAGYRLLGDNVSNSSDSRQRWPEGVPADSIVGRVNATLNKLNRCSTK